MSIKTSLHFTFSTFRISFHVPMLVGLELQSRDRHFCHPIHLQTAVVYTCIKSWTVDLSKVESTSDCLPEEPEIPQFQHMKGSVLFSNGHSIRSHFNLAFVKLRCDYYYSREYKLLYIADCQYAAALNYDESLSTTGTLYMYMETIKRLSTTSRALLNRISNSPVRSRYTSHSLTTQTHLQVI